MTTIKNEYLDKIEGLGHDELPRKVSRFQNPIEITSEQFFALVDKTKGHYGCTHFNAWGSVVNNPCELYASKEGDTPMDNQAKATPKVDSEGYPITTARRLEDTAFRDRYIASHEALLEALKTARNIIAKDNGLSFEDFEKHFPKISQAIAKAEGR